MSRVFTKVSPRLWRSRRFRGLPSEDAKLAFLYLLTSEHQNSAGCYRLPDGYATADLGWHVDRYKKARQQLVEAGMVKFDAAEVFIDGWFTHNPPMNDDHLLGIERQLDRIESDVIREAAHEALSEAVDAIQASRLLRTQKGRPVAYESLNGSGGHVIGHLENTPHMKRANR
jgi:hypothetical protein